MNSQKIGFVLGPKTRMSGALALNRQIFKFFKKKYSLREIQTDSDYFYQVESKVGYVLNYMSNIKKANRFKKIIATNVACLPFLPDHEVLALFHSIDSLNYKAVLDSYRNPNDAKSVDFWIKKSNSLFNLDITGFESDYKLLYSLEKFVAQKCSKIIVVSEKIKEDLTNEFKIKKNKINVILNGIDSFWFQKRQYADRPNVVFTSRIDESLSVFLIKGIDRLLDVFSREKKLEKKIFIHTGSTKQETIRKIEQFLTANARADVISNLNNQELAKQYRAGDIYLTTSRAEACQLTLIEAMAAGMVPICFSAGIVDKYIKNSINGFVVKNYQEALKAISLIAKNEKLRQKMSLSAQQTALKYFGSDRMLSLYSKEIGEFKKMK